MTILPPPHDVLDIAGLLLLAHFVLVKWIEWLLPRAWNYRIAISRLIAVIWNGAFMVIANSGALRNFDPTPPPMAIMMAGVFLLSIAIAFSSYGRNAMAMPFVSLIGLQAFRLPLELLMHRGVDRGIVPVELSYTGYNFDIVTGISAAVLAFAMSRGVSIPRGALWAWNIFGLACLSVIFVVAILGSPMLHRFGTDPGHVNTWVLYFPYVFVPVSLVLVALSGHLVITRKLLSREAF